MTPKIVFNHIGHCVRDIARARRFYEELLGFEFWRQIDPPDDPSGQLLGLQGPLAMTACYLRLDGFVLELLAYGADAHAVEPVARAMDEPGLTHLSISCDIESVCTRVADFGGEVLHDTNIGSAVFIRDPDGQFVELLPLTYADYVASR